MLLRIVGRRDLIVLASRLFLVVWLRWVAEDAYISFRFSRNLADGYGLVFNPGMARVDGYTNFLWVLIGAAFELLHVPPFMAIHGLTVAASVATLLVVWRVAQRDLGLSEGAASSALALLALSPPFAKWATSGMETSAFTLVFFLAATGFAFADGVGLGWAAAAALALSLLRAEAILWVVVLVGLGCAVRWREGRPLAPLLWAAGVGVLPAWTAWFVWRTWYYGALIPNTVVAKVEPAAGIVVRGLGYDLMFVLLELTPLLLPVAAVVALRRLGPTRALWLIALAAAFPAWAALVGGDYMFFFRFIVPGLPFMALLGGVAVDGLVVRRPRLGGALVTAVVLVGLVPAFDIALVPTWILAPLDVNVRGADATGLKLHHGHFRPEGPARVMYDDAVAFRAFTRPGDVVVTAAMGNIPYFNPERRFLDACGLVTRAVAEGEGRDAWTSRAGHEKCVAWWTLDPDRADVVAVQPLETPPTAAQTAQRLRAFAETNRERFLKAGFAPDFVVYRESKGRWKLVAGGYRQRRRQLDEGWATWGEKVASLERGEIGGQLFSEGG